MNHKFYWKIRALLSKWSALLKRNIYLLRHKYEKNNRTKSFSYKIIKLILFKLIIAAIICTAFLMIDTIILNKINIKPLNNQLFLDIIVGGMGIAGVMLGLYCSNMSTIFSSKYTNAPESINKLYQQDILTNKCIKDIIEYITVCVVFLMVCIVNIPFFYASVLLLLLLTIRMIITFSKAGNRAYQLSNTYQISDTVYPEIIEAVDKLKYNHGIYADKYLQNNYAEIVSKNINNLKDIAVYNKEISSNQTKPVICFVKNNIAILFYYLKVKPIIHYSSNWYKNISKYKYWHTTNETESSICARHGVMLNNKIEKDYIWFETAVQEINNISLDIIIKCLDYDSLFEFLYILGKCPKEVVYQKSLDYWIKYFISLKDKILPIITNQENICINENNIARISEAYMLVFYNMIIKICDFIKDINIESEMKHVDFSRKFSDIDFNKSFYLNNEQFENFYNTIATEIKIEKKRITPKWYIEQVIAEQLYNYIHYLLVRFENLYTQVYEIGKILLKEKSFYAAAVWFSHLSELEIKIKNKKIYSILSNLEKALYLKKQNHDIKWENYNLKELQDKATLISTETLLCLKECSEKFAILQIDSRIEFPDMFGYYYNRICDKLVVSIAENDIKTFTKLYKDFLKTVILYQKYIKSDLINPTNNYTIQAKHQIYISPVVEFSIISGLAILWGEFIGSDDWKRAVDSEIALYADISNPEKYKILLDIIDMNKINKQLNFYIGNRMAIQSDWMQIVLSTMQQSPNWKIQYGEYGTKYLNSDSKILNLFMKNTSMFYESLSDVEELFLILTVNPYVDDNKKYHSKSKWEEKIIE